MPEATHIIYTKIDEAPALATYSLLPILQAFTKGSGIELETWDISLTGRIIANFPDNLTDEQKVPDYLTMAGELCLDPSANIVKLPNISASIPQLKAALKELRGFRRIAGETTHMPVEMDCLRALERSDDVDKVWRELKHLGGRPDTFREARVVYGSHLLDTGRPREAWQVVNPKRLEEHPHEAELRQWYVAARVATHLGDSDAAGQILAAITAADPAFPGLDELEAAIGG